MTKQALAGLLLSLPIGIISGLYASLIVTRYTRFSDLRNEALRIVRGINFVGYDETLTVSGTEVVKDLAHVASELVYLGHSAAGLAVREIHSEIIGCSIDAERGAIKVVEYANWYARWQEVARSLSPSKKIFWPIGKL